MKRLVKYVKYISVVLAFMFIAGICTAGIINAAGNYNYGSAVPSQKLYFANRKEIFSIFGAKSEVFLL